MLFSNPFDSLALEEYRKIIQIACSAKKTKMIHFQGTDYFDDRVFVLSIQKVITKDNSEEWCLVTRRNTVGFPPTRADDFDSLEKAEEYKMKVEPQTPRISLGGHSPEPVPTYEEHKAWLAEILAC